MAKRQRSRSQTGWVVAPKLPPTPGPDSCERIAAALYERRPHGANERLRRSQIAATAIFHSSPDGPFPSQEGIVTELGSSISIDRQQSTRHWPERV